MTSSNQESTYRDESESAAASNEYPMLLTWRVGEDGQITSRPEADRPADVWLKSESVEEKLIAAAAGWMDGKDDTACELFDGCALAPVARAEGKEGAELIVAMIFEPHALDSREFGEVCQTHAVLPEIMRVALEPIILTRDTHVRQLSRLMSQIVSEQEQAAQNAFAAGDLAKQLTDTYEQLSFLYRLSREMTTLDCPRQFVEAIAKQLLHLLDFQWVAVKYIPSKLALPDLESGLILEGTMTCPLPIFNDLSEHLITGFEADDWTHILLPEDSPIAAAVGSEVLVEEIAYDENIIGAIMAGDKQGHDLEVSSGESQLFDAAAGILGAFHQNVTRYAELKSLFMGTVRALTATVDAKDPYTRGHSDRVAHLARDLALAARLSPKEAEDAFLAGVVHDVGKIGVPESILRKAGRLTDEEFAIIKSHPITGFDILKDIPQMSDVISGVLHHHERWDGKGYPHAVEGQQIPIIARLLALPDAFDAMCSNRAYRAGMTRDKVLEEIDNCAGGQFDPHLARIFARLDFSQYDEMVANHRGQDAYAA